jgi:hypothetical protein
MGIVEPDLPDLTSREIKERKEQDIVGRLLGLLGYSGFSLSNPNSPKEESGADVLVRWKDREIGFQVTEYQPDAGKRGSRLREKEAVRAKAGVNNRSVDQSVFNGILETDSQSESQEKMVPNGLPRYETGSGRISTATWRDSINSTVAGTCED